MNRGLYAAATGMTSLQRTLDTLSNNLANVSTNGFKKDGVSFNDLMKRQLYANGGAGDLVGTYGNGPTESAEFTSFEMGAFQRTSNPFDIALDSSTAMIGVRTPNNDIRYTRNGALRAVDQNGTQYLSDPTGNLVLDDRDQPIALGTSSDDFEIEIDKTGVVKVVQGEETREVGQIGLFEGQFTKSSGGLYECANPQVLPDERSSIVQSGYIEASNVNSLEEMTELIRVGRQFEMSQKAMQTQDDLLQQLIQSLQKS